MMKMFKLMFFNSMMIGTFITISANSWLSAWIGLEINLLSIIPLLKNNKNKFPSEAALKYFIAQLMGSSLLLFSISMFLISKSSIEQLSKPETMILSSALLLKMGAAPLHFWFPEVLSGLSWANTFIMLTWQKIGPMILLSYLIKTNVMFFSFIIIISSMISGLQGLNQTSLRKILAYSSINHISWMISSLLTSINIFFFYFLIYSLINLNIIIILKKYNIIYMNQLNNILSFKKKLKFLFMLNFLSLGGLPPFLGFLPKWLTINSLVENNHYFITTMLIIFTLITLYFYMRITFSSFTIYSMENLLINFKKSNYFHYFFNFMCLMGLMYCSMMDSFM